MSPTTNRPHTPEHEVVRLGDLVQRQLQAELRNFKLTETSDTEYIFVVLWRKTAGSTPLWGREYGTHRACLSRTSDEAMLVWGHYDLDVVEANKDFVARIHNVQ